MSIIQKAHELAQALQESEELCVLRDLEAQLLNESSIDEEGSLYKEYTTAYHRFSNLLESIRYILTKSYDGKIGFGNGCVHCCKKNKKKSP